MGKDIKNVTIILVDWKPDRLFPHGGHACDVEIKYRDNSVETKSTRMYSNPKAAWQAAESIKARLLNAR
jgi:hypothetical protein